MEMAVTNYINCLVTDNQHDLIAVYRVIAIWSENEENETMRELIQVRHYSPCPPALPSSQTLLTLSSCSPLQPGVTHPVLLLCPPARHNTPCPPALPSSQALLTLSSCSPLQSGITHPVFPVVITGSDSWPDTQL